MTRLKGRSALITGAARGIGRAMAEKFAGEGCALGLVDLNREGAEETAAALRELGARAVAVAADVTDRPSVDRALAEVSAELGPPDILVNNAGIFEIVPFEEMTFAQWQRMLDVNLNSLFHVTQSYVRRMLNENRGGNIINLASISGIVAFTASSHYGVTKAGVAQLTRCLAMEYAQFGFRVNAMAPGIIESEMTRGSLAESELAAEWLHRIPSRRYGSVSNVADLALFLASDESSYINGTTIVVDGGAVPAFTKPDDPHHKPRRDWQLA
jgi:3-oxoacyl-[acyl-carrier protein] reductase